MLFELVELARSVKLIRVADIVGLGIIDNLLD